jgi:beta-lactamase regulating signal transducer with metallopeptidase domain
MGQTFLFGAAATYGSTVQPDHYPLLLLGIPILGMLLAALWFIVARKAVTHIKRQHADANTSNINAMRETKSIAYQAIVDHGRG